MAVPPHLLTLVLPLVAGCLLLAGGLLRPRLWNGWRMLYCLVLAGMGWGVSNGPPESADSLAGFGAWVAISLGFVLMMGLGNGAGPDNRHAAGYGLLLLSVCAVLRIAVADNLVTAVLAWVLLAVCQTVLLWWDAGGGLLHGMAVKRFLLSAVTLGLLLTGCGLLYAVAGTTTFPGIRSALAAQIPPADPGMLTNGTSFIGLIALLLITAGIGFSMSIVPFLFGSVEIAGNASLWWGGFAALTSQVAGVLLLLKLVVESLSPLGPVCAHLLIVAAICTFAVGSVSALRERRLRQLLAWLFVSGGGFLLAGLAVASHDARHPAESLAVARGLPGGWSVVMLTLIIEGMTLSGLWLLLIWLRHSHRAVETIDDLAGLSRSDGVSATCLTTMLVSLSGLPPLPGFWARLFLISAIISTRQLTPGELPTVHPAFILLVVAVLTHAVLSAVLCGKLVSVIIFQPARGRLESTGGESALGGGVLLAMMIIGLGLLPWPLVEAIQIGERSRPQLQQAASARSIREHPAEVSRGPAALSAVKPDSQGQ